MNGDCKVRIFSQIGLFYNVWTWRICSRGSKRCRVFKGCRASILFELQRADEVEFQNDSEFAATYHSLHALHANLDFKVSTLVIRNNLLQNMKFEKSDLK